MWFKHSAHIHFPLLQLHFNNIRPIQSWAGVRVEEEKWHRSWFMEQRKRIHKRTMPSTLTQKPSGVFSDKYLWPLMWTPFQRLPLIYCTGAIVIGASRCLVSHIWQIWLILLRNIIFESIHWSFESRFDTCLLSRSCRSHRDVLHSFRVKGVGWCIRMCEVTVSMASPSWQNQI